MIWMAMDRRLKIGCGIVGGVVLLAVLLVLGGGIWLAKDMAKHYKAVQKSEEALLETTGGLEAYDLPPGGVPSAERIEAFVDVRSELSEWRANLATELAAFLAEQDQDDGGFRQTVRLLQAGSDLAPAFAGFWTARNEALLAHRMSPTEYVTLYALAYYAYLGYEPIDGRAGTLRLPGGVEMSGGGGLESGSDPQTDPGTAGPVVLVRRVLMPRLESLSPAATDDGARATGLNRAEIEAELARLAADPDRWPWRDDLPRVLADAFRPHRKVLEETYIVSVNPVELLFETAE